MSESFSFDVPGRVPSLNDVAGKGHWRRASKPKRTWTRHVATCAGRAQGVRLALPKPARIDLHIIEPDRKRDPDNVAACARKYVHDGLVLAGVLLGDGWRYVVPDLRTTLEVGIGPRIEVIVSWGVEEE